MTLGFRTDNWKRYWAMILTAEMANTIRARYAFIFYTIKKIAIQLPVCPLDPVRIPFPVVVGV
jgi:hypothetical protein